jgi:hypothetical protein
MPSPRFRLLLAALLAAGLLGCDTTATQPEPQVVVEAYLRAQAPLPPVRLTQTIPVSGTFRPRQAGISGADVRIDRLTDDSTVAETTVYTETDSVPGLYAPTTAPVVQPEATYRLRAETPDGDRLRATTTVPDSIPLVEVENDTAAYQSANQPAFTIEPPRALADRQNVYTFTTTSLLDFEGLPDSTLRAALTPFYREDLDDDSLETLRVISSGLLNEGNFQQNADGTITVDLPWLAVAFLGPNRVAINVVDDNYYDLLRSQQAQQSSFAPGEIPNVIEHVEGGTGVFGSYAQAAARVIVIPPQGGGAARTGRPRAGARTRPAGPHP